MHAHWHTHFCFKGCFSVGITFVKFVCIVQVLLKIDADILDTFPMAKVHKLLLGPAGSTVQIKYQRPPGQYEMTCTLTLAEWTRLRRGHAYGHTYEGDMLTRGTRLRRGHAYAGDTLRRRTLILILLSIAQRRALSVSPACPKNINFGCPHGLGILKTWGWSGKFCTIGFICTNMNCTAAAIHDSSVNAGGEISMGLLQ